MTTSTHVNVAQSALWECPHPLQESVNSDGLEILAQQWKLVARDEEGYLSVQLQYLGPKDGCQVKYFDIEIVGGGSGYRKRSKKELPFQRGAKSFEVSQITKLKDAEKHAKNGKLPLKVTITVSIPSAAPETATVLDEVAMMTAPGFKVPKSRSKRSSSRKSGSRSSLGDLKLKVEKLTLERNSLHRSLHDMKLDESTAAMLTSAFPSQPEVMDRYDSFVSKLSPILLDLYMEFGDDSTSKVAATLKSSALSMKNFMTHTWHKNKIAQLKALSGLSDGKIATLEALLSNMIRTTFSWSKVLDQEEEQAVAEALNVFPKNLRQKFEFFPKFVYFLVMYSKVATHHSVRWDTIGMETGFNGEKHRALDEKIESGKPVVVLFPPLVANKSKKSSVEVLSKALVVDN